MNYYVYRFKDKDNNILYVGRTINLKQRFVQHDHLTSDVVKIEYTVCNTYADMVWKEIYYINYFHNNLMTNDKDVYDKVTDLKLYDIWREYNPKDFSVIENAYEIHNECTKILDNIPNIDYQNLIHIIEDIKLNDIGKNQYSLSSTWFQNITEQDKKKLKNNIVNFVRNKCHAPSSTVSWRVYSKNQKDVSDKGYSKGYYSIFDVNCHREEKTCLVYIENNFAPQVLKDELKITDDEYALCRMLTFLFDSALYYGKPINVYMPSARMRAILKEWIYRQSMN